MDFLKGPIQTCLQHEPPFCTVGCPFHVDVRDFIAKLQRGAFQAAYRAYLNAVGFPAIVAALCPEPCQQSCPRKACGGAIAMRRLERAAMAYARDLTPNAYNLPPKGKRVAIVGAGISGLACALRMAERAYDVTVYERSDRIGGQLHQLLPPDVFLTDIARQFQHVTYTLRLETEIRSLGELDADAIYIATGSGGADFAAPPAPEGAFASIRPGVFLGGALTGKDTMGALADGLKAAHALERWLKVGSMKHPEDALTTQLELDVSHTPFVPVVTPSQGDAFTREEAVAEAQRCLSCACNACMQACDLMAYFKKSPKRIAEEVHLSVHPGTLDGNGTLATRLMSTCNQCGLCKEVCPKHIDTGELLLHGHHAMRERDAMPWAWHDVFLRDMASAQGEAALARQPEGCTTSTYLFFPGCQLGASDPRYVTESYAFLRRHWPDTALALGCCGAPAEWAGEADLRDEAVATLRELWTAFGRPTAVFACPMCSVMLKRHLPELRGVFLYDLMHAQGVLPPAALQGTVLSVFDPCASRTSPELQAHVRDLVLWSGAALEALPLEGRRAQCCGYGGQVEVAHPPYAKHVAKARAAAGEAPFVTYCANCRDSFAAVQKPARHILDVVFGLDDGSRPHPTLTARRRHRLSLKRQLLETWWGETLEPEEVPMDLHMSAALRQQLHEDHILETEIAAVITHCEQTGRKAQNPATGAFSGHLRIGHMTYWAEYAPQSDGRVLLHKAYGHRMSIDP